MFACVRGEEEDSVLGSSAARVRQDQDADDDIINRVLEEGLRLKKRCKTLTLLLEERETQLAAERDARESSALSLHDKVQFEVSKVDQSHAMEIARLQADHQEECAQLYQQLDVARAEGRHLEEQSRVWRDRVDVLERDKAALKEELRQVQSDYEAERKAVVLRRDDGLATEQRTISLRRALLAESEVQRLLSDTATAERAVAVLREELSRAQAQVQAQAHQLQTLQSLQSLQSMQAMQNNELSVTVPAGLDREDSCSLAVSPPSPGGCSFALSELPSPFPDNGTPRPSVRATATATVTATAMAGALITTGHAGTVAGTSTQASSPTCTQVEGEGEGEGEGEVARLQALLEASTSQLRATEDSRAQLERDIQHLRTSVDLEQEQYRQLKTHCDDLEQALQDAKEEVDAIQL